jgi:SAM-dependent methyltransferase
VPGRDARSDTSSRKPSARASRLAISTAVAIRWLNATRDDDSYDLVYAFSVFTHITDAWVAWLIELHRVLSPGGWLIASFLGEGMSRAIAGEPWDPDRIGMNILQAHQNWNAGGPSVLLAPWWIREELERTVRGYEMSRSWRLTAPLRWRPFRDS